MAQKIPVTKRTSEEPRTKTESQPAHTPPPMPKLLSFNRMVLSFMAALALLMIIDPVFMRTMGEFFGLFLNPLIGFDYRTPVLTVLLAGLILTLFSSIIRNYLTDWVEFARTQKILTAFNKIYRETLRSNNTAKMQKLSKHQARIMEMNWKNMTTQLKMMVYTMFVFIATFAWFSVFIGSLPDKSITVPWATNVHIGIAQVIFPNYILLYGLFAIPFGQVITKILKDISLKRKLKDSE